MRYTGYEPKEATPTDPEPVILGSFEEGVQGGIQIAVDLVRSGASIDEVATLTDSDPAQDDPDAYQTRLAQLRAIMKTGFQYEAQAKENGHD